MTIKPLCTKVQFPKGSCLEEGKKVGKFDSSIENISSLKAKESKMGWK
jgi:hypothetical protein